MTRRGYGLACVMAASGCFGVGMGMLKGEVTASASTRPQERWKRCFAQGSPNRKQIALTFDDGPTLNGTPRLIAILRKHRAKATFFVLGERVRRYPRLTQRLVEQGHEVGNHSHTHRNFHPGGATIAFGELSDCMLAMEDVLGFRPTICRPPGGAANPDTLEVAENLGMKVVYWSVNPADYKWLTNPDEVLARCLRNIRPGSVVLLHEKVPATVAMLDELLTTLTAQGYEFVTVSELMALDDTPDERELIPRSWLLY